MATVAAPRSRVWPIVAAVCGCLALVLTVWWFARGPVAPVSPDRAIADVADPTAPQADAQSVAEIHGRRAALNALRESFGAVREFAAANPAPEQWADVDRRYAWLLEDDRWQSDLLRGAKRATTLREQIERRRALAREALVQRGREVIERAVLRARTFTEAGAYQQALDALERIHAAFHGLPAYQRVAAERALVLDVIDRLGRGDWIDVGDSLWKLQPPHRTRHDADGALVFEGVGERPGILVFTPVGSKGWSDYAIELECKVVDPQRPRSGIVLGVRVQRHGKGLRGGGFTWQPSMAGDWHTLRLQVRGAKVTTTLDGAAVANDGAGPFTQGPPMLLLPAGCQVHVRTARYKLLGRRG